MGFRQCSPYQAETGKIYHLKQHFVPPATACNEELLCLVASKFLIYIHTRCLHDFVIFVCFFSQTGFITESSTVSIFTRMLLKPLVRPSTLFLIKILLASNL